MNQRQLIRRVEGILKNNSFISINMEIEMFIRFIEINEIILNGNHAEYTDLEKMDYVINFLYASNAITEEETDNFIALLNELEEGSYKE